MDSDAVERALQGLNLPLLRRAALDNIPTFETARDGALPALKTLKESCGFSVLSDLTALDLLKHPRDQLDRFAVVYHLRHPGERAFVRLKVLVPETDPRLPSALPLWIGADWPEREVFDMFGIRFDGHPDLRRLLLPETFQHFPLRKDYPMQGLNERNEFPAWNEALEEPEEPGEAPGIGRAGERRTLVLNLGPQHPAMHGTLRNVVELDGERIRAVRPEIGFLHTGFEKHGESLTYNQYVTTTDRMNYLSPFNNNVAFTMSAEALGAVEVPERGQWARVLLCELSRIADHVICVGLMAMDLGAFSLMLWTFIEREKLYDLFEYATGGRMMTSWTRVGGSFRDLPEGWLEEVGGFAERFPAALDDFERALDRNPIWHARTRGIGVLDPETAQALGVTGPVLRASGVPYDVRRDFPYLVYPWLDFDVVTETDGDSFARYRLRMREMRQSLRIIRQCLERMPRSGPFTIADGKVALPPKDAVYNEMEALIHHFKIVMPGHGYAPPDGAEAYVPNESPNGELGFYVVSDGSGVPYRVRVRPPSLYNYQAFAPLSRGLKISDAISVLAGLNVIAGELDR